MGGCSRALLETRVIVTAGAFNLFNPAWRWIRRPISILLGVSLGVLLSYFLVFFSLSAAIYSQGFEHYATRNGRGDKLSVDTVVNHAAPFVTVVTLRRAWGLSSTTLVTVTSSTLWVDLRWRDDDHAEISFSSDPDSLAGQPVSHVGPIQFTYSFQHTNEPLRPHGYVIE